MGHVLYLLLALWWLSPPSLDRCDSLQAVEWLLGEWQAKRSEHVVVESWKPISAGTYEGFGESRSVASGKREFVESLRMVEMSGQVFYLAKVDHNALPIAFRLTVCEPGHAVFENAEHDFPKRLEYQKIAQDEMVVSVSDGEERGFEIRFGRVAAEHNGDR